jgi:hypothetical protein
MRRAITLLVLIGSTITLSRACSAWQQFPVKVFNEAAVGNSALETAQQEASWLLGSACVQVIWVPCRPVTRSNLIPCPAPVNSAELHVLSAPLTADTGRTAMGFAMPRYRSSGHAAVFLSRVRHVVDSNPGLISVPHLLGEVMAHEIGHLLLRSSIHSSEGIMRADYRPSDLKNAGQRQLRFTPEQIQAIQSREFAGRTLDEAAAAARQ